MKELTTRAMTIATALLVILPASASADEVPGVATVDTRGVREFIGYMFDSLSLAAEGVDPQLYPWGSIGPIAPRWPQMDGVVELSSNGGTYSEPWTGVWIDGSYHFSNCRMPEVAGDSGNMKAFGSGRQHVCWSGAGTWSNVRDMAAGEYNVEYIFKEQHTKITPGGSFGGGCSSRQAIGWIVGGVYDLTAGGWVDTSSDEELHMLRWDTGSPPRTVYESRDRLYFGTGSFRYDPTHDYTIGIYVAAWGGANCWGFSTEPSAKVTGKGEAIIAAVS